jgi:hypothetical protein
MEGVVMETEGIQVDLKLPSLEIAGMWQPDESEHNASWEMYVELVTRISGIEARPGEGRLRDALTSLHHLVAETRRILRSYGPIVAQPSGGGDLSFGYIAVAVSNLVLRPLLDRWHLLLQEWESRKPAEVSLPAHEQSWDRAIELRQELTQVRAVLGQYAALLEKAAGVPPLPILTPS